MYPALPHGVTVTVVLRQLAGTQDEYGNDEYTETQQDVFPCAVHPAATTETYIMTEELTDDITVFLPAGSAVDYLSAIIWEGTRYEVQGRPNRWTSPFSGRISPVQVQCHRQTGVSV
jgi:hypothetical protein